MSTKKKAPDQAAAPAAKSAASKKEPPKQSTKAAGKGPGKGIFKQPLQKPQPWSFGGRGARPQDEGAKAQPDAERLAGKSRKVH